MKYIIITVVILGALLGGYAYSNKTEKVVEYVQGKTITEVKEVNPLDEKIKAREAELEEKYNKIQAVEARIDVKKAEVKRLEDEILADQKELAGFMIATSSKR